MMFHNPAAPLLALALLTIPAAATSSTSVQVRHLCSELDATIVGTTHNDVIEGTRGQDVIQAGRGNDVIVGLDGNDFICGGPGNDVIIPGGGLDGTFGGHGHDVCIGVKHEAIKHNVFGCEGP